MFEYHQVLARMRQGDSDRDIARAALMERKKRTTMQRQIEARGWLDPAQPLPVDAVIAGSPHLPHTCVSTTEPFPEQIPGWEATGAWRGSD
ncbi:hypothetical protein [Paraburkholderia bengalensis]|uniref:hypothetical protein n=1 Tax=Paraburkholderia bengalensis TaxID=2747562 RepID=UPI0030148519